MNEAELRELLVKILSLSRETEWIEFKVDNAKPEDIGEYISALSNSAALHRQDFGYIVWGIEDATYKVVGTHFKPHQSRNGSEELENWITHLLSPRINFRFYEFTHGGYDIALAVIPAATHTPVSFKEVEYVRVGTYKHKLHKYPEKERVLWGEFTHLTFEKDVARANVLQSDIGSLIDIPAFFNLINKPIPTTQAGMVECLKSEGILTERGSQLSITNLGAILFAKELDLFEQLKRKAVRVVLYKGSDRIRTVMERLDKKGYAVGFEGLVDFINQNLPTNEQISRALRRQVPLYPEVAIRELVANALIHQDFEVTGSGPIIEIFTDRIEITNPGAPLIDTLRFVDLPPQSRNESLASLMRRIGVCEERGSGIDKVVYLSEVFQLPAPNFSVTENRHTRAVLYSYKEFKDMDRNDRIRACYLHACLRFISNQQMTNASLRERFGISEDRQYAASRVITDTLDAKLIKQYNPDNTSRRHAKYIPFWG